MNKSNSAFNEIGREWLEHKRTEVKETTYSRYEALFKKHLLPVFGNKKIKEINREFVREYLKDLSETYKYNTVGSIFDVLYSIMHYAGDDEFPEIRKFKLEKSNTSFDVLSESEYMRINVCLRKYTIFRDLGILLALNMGLRIGEVCGLRWEDIDFNKGIIRIRRTVQRVKSYDEGAKTKIAVLEPKSRCSIREIAISESIKGILMKMKNDIDDNKAYLLSGKADQIIEPRNMERYFEKKCIEIIGRKIKFHELRHTFATLTISNGTDVKVVSKILGHSSIITTLKFYRKVSIRDMSDCVNNIEKLLANQMVS